MKKKSSGNSPREEPARTELPGSTGSSTDELKVLLGQYYFALAKKLRLKKSEEEIEELIADLRNKAAEGSQPALRLLYRYAMTSAAALEEVAQSNHDFVREFASTQGGWPVRLGPYPKVIKERLEELDKLGVGTRTSSVVAPKKLFRDPKNKNTVRDIVKTALYMIQACRDFEKAQIAWKITEHIAGVEKSHTEVGLPKMLCSGDEQFLGMVKDLPELSTEPEAFEKWYEAVKRAMEIESNNHPEERPHLKQVGLYRGKHFSALTNKGTWSEGSVLANERAGIWKAVRRTLKALAPDPRPLPLKNS